MQWIERQDFKWRDTFVHCHIELKFPRFLVEFKAKYEITCRIGAIPEERKQTELSYVRILLYYCILLLSNILNCMAQFI
jgi:hypothetical protein